MHKDMGRKIWMQRCHAKIAHTKCTCLEKEDLKLIRHAVAYKVNDDCHLTITKVL